MKPVAILGCGPAGLMAAHAVGLSGRPVAMFSKGDEHGELKRSRLGGAQFLHRAIPHICEEDKPDSVIGYKLTGTVEGYRKKVYGTTKVPFVSMSGRTDGEIQPAWSLQSAYDKLWNFLGPESVGNVVSLTPEWIKEALEKEWFDAILSTVPLPELCQVEGGHHFATMGIRIANEAMHNFDNCIWYNGNPEQSWYRSANLFGNESTEWGGEVRPSLTDTFHVTKPLRTNCDCFAGSVVRLGRYGSWTKGVLTHHAFEGAQQVMAEL